MSFVRMRHSRRSEIQRKPRQASHRAKSERTTRANAPIGSGKRPPAERKKPVEEPHREGDGHYAAGPGRGEEGAGPGSEPEGRRARSLGEQRLHARAESSTAAPPLTAVSGSASVAPEMRAAFLLLLALAAGPPQAPPAAPAAVPSPVPSDLAVAGVVVGRTPARSSAILASGGKTRVVAVGESAFGARLVSVAADAVILERDGERRELRLPTTVVASALPVPAAPRRARRCPRARPPRTPRLPRAR